MPFRPEIFPSALAALFPKQAMAKLPPQCVPWQAGMLGVCYRFQPLAAAAPCEGQRSLQLHLKIESSLVSTGILSAAAQSMCPCD